MGSVAHVTRETIYIYDTYYKQHSSFEYIHVYTWHSLYLHLSSTLLNQQDDVEQPLLQSKSGDVIIPNKSKSSSNPGSSETSRTANSQAAACDVGSLLPVYLSKHSLTQHGNAVVHVNTTFDQQQLPSSISTRKRCT